MSHNDIWHLNIQNGRIFGLEGDVFGINKEEVEFIIKDKGKDNYKYNTFGRLRGSYVTFQPGRASGGMFVPRLKRFPRASPKKVLVSVQSIDQNFTYPYISDPSKHGGEFRQVVCDFSNWEMTEAAADVLSSGLLDSEDDVFVRIQVKSILNFSFGLHGVDYLLQRSYKPIA